MRPIAAVDVDHTLAESAWRDCLMPLDHRAGDWTMYYSLQRDDRPRAGVIEFVRSLARFHDIFVNTAREERYREDTEWWLTEMGVPHVATLMRPHGDKTATPLLKVRNLQPVWNRLVLVIDDREDVLDAFRALGVNVANAAQM